MAAPAAPNGRPPDAMSITCPSCDASYRIDPAVLGDGRKVRCARCRTEWFAAGGPPAGDPADEGADLSLAPIPGLDDAYPVDAVDRPETVDAVILPAGRESRPRLLTRAGLRSGGGRSGLAGALRPSWPRRLAGNVRPIAVVAALAVAACGLVVGERETIVGAAPSLASFYGALGLPVNVRGLAIEDVRSVENVEEGVPLLLVTGVVRNVAAGPRDVPRLRLAVTGGGDRELYAWTTVAARSKLDPGESAAFRARLASPPADGRGVAVRFLARQDIVATASR
jgi:predicted Zn finger-like uncharacterized protein